MEGHIFTDEVIEPDYHKSIQAQLNRLSPNVTKIVHHIASSGGSVYGGYKGYHVLKGFGKPIKSIIEGEAQSMATFIALAGDEVEILDPSVFMIHNPKSGVEGDADAMEGGGLELRKIENDMAKVYSDKTGIPIDQIKAMMKKETRFTAQEAVTSKFVDKISTERTLNTQQYNTFKAVALGKTMEENKEQSILDRIEKTIEGILKKKPATAEGPKAIDLAGTDGKMYNIASENGDLVGKPITVSGAPVPDGTIPLSDGRSLVVSGGLVTEVKEAMSAEQKAMEEMKAKLAAAEQAKAELEAKVQQTTIAAEQAKTELQTTAVALGDIKTEVEKLKKETVGDDKAPNKGKLNDPVMKNNGPIAQEQRDETIVFLSEYFSWLKPYYPKGTFEKAIENYTARKGPQAVSILETNFNYTYPGILTTDIFYKPSLGNPALSDLFMVDQGIKDKKRYNLVNPISKILKPYTGCDRVFNNNRAFITNTTVQTKEFQVNESWCKDDFTGYLTGGFNYLAEQWLKNGIDSFDPSGTPIARVIDTVLSNALRLDVFRRVSFAAGNSSDDDYNQFDGLWDRLIDSSGASNYCVVRAGAALGTGTLAAGAALTALESVYANSNILLRDWDNIYAQFSGAVQKPTFWVTRSVWDNYYNSLIGTGAVTEQQFENLTKGLTTLTYKGFPVRPVSLWDQFLTESDNPLFATTRHLILFTTRDNHILGVEQGSDLNKIEGWYERKDRKFYYEADMKMGYNYLHCDLQTIAY